MSATGPQSPAPDQGTDVTRRTWLAAERTWLAWWRSGVAVGAAGLAVGRLLPDLTRGAHWPFQVLGIGYGLLSVAVLLVGAFRQQRASSALRRGTFEELTSPLVALLTAGGVLLSVTATVVIVVDL
jgi:inner membrane protein YidH